MSLTLDPAVHATPELDRAMRQIVSIPDYPKPGVVFRDIMPLIADPASLSAITAALLEPFAGRYDAIAGVEARGFLLGGVAAAVAGVGLVPIRKAGKLARPAGAQAYALEYGEAEVEMQCDLPRGTRVLIIDDVLATGGTLGAAIELTRAVGYEPVGVSVLLELDSFEGRTRLGGLETRALFHT